MIETCDLYRGAYLLCCGGHLQELRKRHDNYVSFIIEGDLMKEDLRYKSGQALVNPLDLRKFLNFLRDQLKERKHHEKATRRPDQTNQGKYQSSRRSPKTRY